MFSMKILLILLKFHEETLSCSGDIKIFRQGKRMYMYSLPPFKEEVLSEERQLMKWVGIFQVEIFWLGIFRGGKRWGGGGSNIPGGSLLGGTFPDGNFPWVEFS